MSAPPPDQPSPGGEDETQQKPRAQPGRRAKGGSGRIPDLFERADDLDTQLNTATENGLFEHQHEVDHDAVLAPLSEAIEISLSPGLTPGQFAEGIRKYDTALHQFNKALGAVSLWRKLSYIYGIPSLAYMLAVLAFDFWLVFKFLPGYASGLPFLSIPLEILVAGSVGSVLRGMTNLWYNVDRKQYRKVWATWYLLSPFIGALLGGLVYLAFYVGIAVTTSGAAISNPVLLILVAALAGYNWEWSRDVLAKAVEVFSVK